MERCAIIVSDIHAPFHSEPALAVAYQVVAAAQPELLVLNGDIVDFYQLSRFDQDPQRKLKLQEDLTVAKKLIRELRQAAPKARMVFKEGNHEHRLYKWACRNPEMAGLDCLKLTALLDLGAVNSSVVESHQRLTWEGWTITHGDLCRKNGGATGQAMIEKFGTNGVSGHVHRLALVEKRDSHRSYQWVEGGCLCGLQPEYLEVANWAHGLTILTLAEGVVWPQLVRIDAGRCYWNGRVYRA